MFLLAVAVAFCLRFFIITVKAADVRNARYRWIYGYKVIKITIFYVCTTIEYK